MKVSSGGQNRQATRMLFSTLTLLVVGTTLVGAQNRGIEPIQPRKQVALVIGNSAYWNRPLINPTNDAQDVGGRLGQLGFQGERLFNLDRKKMAEAVDRFIARLGPGDVALFYYSGHGVQVDGENYLIPVDFTGQTETDMRYDAFAAGRIQDRMERSGAKLSILILDACRDNPTRASVRSGMAGLAPMNAVKGTFVAFATAPGRTASDNPSGRNGLFTEYLLEALQRPGWALDDVFNYVRERVDVASQGQQLPWSQSGVVGRYIFLPEAAPTVDARSRVEGAAVQTFQPRTPVNLLKKGEYRGYKLNCVNGHRKDHTKETRWPLTSNSSTDCWRTTRTPKTS